MPSAAMSVLIGSSIEIHNLCRKGFKRHDTILLIVTFRKDVSGRVGTLNSDIGLGLRLGLGLVP